MPEFERDGRELRVRVDGQLILNSLPQRIDAAENGLGLAYVPEDAVQDALAEGRLVRVLEVRVRLLPVIISIIRAAASTLSRLHYLSQLCGIHKFYL